MSEFIGSGLNGEVYGSNARDKILFPQANVAKTTFVVEPVDMFMLFYTHKIAELLVPESSLKVSGIYNDRNAVIKSDVLRKRYSVPERDYAIKVLSSMVDVHPAHRNFSTHSTNGHFIFEMNHSWKDLSCNDIECKEHEKLHTTKEWKQKFNEAKKRYQEIGITVPKTDATDWCLDSNGQIIFFELEHLNANRLNDYLSSLKNPNQNQRRAYELMKRFEHHFYERYRSWGFDVPERPKELEFNTKSWIKTQMKKLPFMG